MNTHFKAHNRSSKVARYQHISSGMIIKGFDLVYQFVIVEKVSIKFGSLHQDALHSTGNHCLFFNVSNGMNTNMFNSSQPDYTYIFGNQLP